MQKSIMKEGWIEHKRQLLETNQHSESMTKIVAIVDAAAEELARLVDKFSYEPRNIPMGMVMLALLNADNRTGNLFSEPINGLLYKYVVYGLLGEWLKDDYAFNLWLLSIENGPAAKAIIDAVDEHGIAIPI